MKKALYATAGSALALVLLAASAPAFADVNAFATINKTKDITVTEQITIHKTVTIFVGTQFTDRDITAAAEADALLNVTNSNNKVDGQDINVDEDGNPVSDHGDPPGTDYHIQLSAVIGGEEGGSVNNNIGVFGFNQDVGNMTNQGNAVSVAGISNLPAFANSQAEADQSNTDNSSYDFERIRSAEDGHVLSFEDIQADHDPTSFQVGKSTLIDGSINTNTGVINVNQNAGNMNNQNNGVALAVGLGALVALSEGALGQTNAGNFVSEVETVKTDTISDSINGNTGIVNVNQSVGNMNNQGNVVSLAAVASGAIIASPPQ
ncbi:MAG TPA: hypothetical protein VHA10_24215 [Hypericibacter adhaerens]|jgi:hypothetical protein|uniref:Uncharacterized protein n=1 Tax=Hypericibacter adhaerens TaxID=2602016 RepID=A0A5J6N515_9PROT|nr:hypothetical protein [Hypericibacter adhaerens]QEX21996.1 hypothetical protein FRZ61_19250 [Hypericibacter adhaerens]HWA46345.1 hypothetical protein [Hypericibacter adhaerens]